jgi:site-specific DNA-methyltransferase (adenine-specific)
MVNNFQINKIYHGDCLDIMKDIPDNYVNHIICDLPFFQVVKDEWDNQWANEKEYIDWCREIIIEYKRIIKDNGNLFLFTGRQYNRKIATILDEFFNEKRIIIWARKRNFNNTRGRALASGYEPICYYCNGLDGTFNNVKVKPDTKRKEYVDGFLKDGITLSDVWNDIPALPHNSKEKLPHSTQKPQKLIERLIQIGTNEGDLILDNCSGSGTLGVECIKNNRDFIMIEQNEDYYNMSLKRIDDLLENQNN